MKYEIKAPVRRPHRFRSHHRNDGTHSFFIHFIEISFDSLFHTEKNGPLGFSLKGQKTGKGLFALFEFVNVLLKVHEKKDFRYID